MKKKTKIWPFLWGQKRLILGWFVITLIVDLVALLFVFFSSVLNPIAVSTAAIMGAILLVMKYEYLSKKSEKEWFNQNQGILSLIGILAATALFFLGDANEYLKSDAALRQENATNSRLMSLLVRDLAVDPAEPIWQNVSNDAYKTYRRYIDTYASKDCQYSYANLLSRLDTVDNMNRKRQDIQLEKPYLAEELGRQLVVAASSTLLAYRGVEKDCYKMPL